MSFDFKGFGVDLTNIKDFEQALADYKKSLREDAKANTASVKASAVDATNAAIANGTLVKGASVIVLYKKNQVVGTLKTTPTKDTKNLAVLSDSFENKDHFAYVDKSNFVSLA